MNFRDRIKQLGLQVKEVAEACGLTITEAKSAVACLQKYGGFTPDSVTNKKQSQIDGMRIVQAYIERCERNLLAANITALSEIKNQMMNSYTPLTKEEKSRLADSRREWKLRNPQKTRPDWGYDQSEVEAFLQQKRG